MPFKNQKTQFEWVKIEFIPITAVKYTCHSTKKVEVSVNAGSKWISPFCIDIHYTNKSIEGIGIHHEITAMADWRLGKFIGDDLNGIPLIVKLTDNNGHAYICGQLEQPLLLTYENRANGPEDGFCTQFQISGDTLYPLMDLLD